MIRRVTVRWRRPQKNQKLLSVGSKGPDGQTSDSLLYDFGSHRPVPSNIGHQQRVVADVVDVPWNAFGSPCNQADSVRCEEWFAGISRHTEPVIDIAGCFGRSEGFQMA